MNQEVLDAIREEAPKYREMWLSCFAIPLAANVLTEDDINFLALHTEAEGVAEEYQVESGQAPIMNVGTPSQPFHVVVQDDPEHRRATASRAYRLLAELYQSTPEKMTERHHQIIQGALDYQNNLVARRRLEDKL